MGKNGVATFSQLFLNKSFSYLQVMMIYIRAWMSLKFGQIRSGTKEFAALEHLKWFRGRVVCALDYEAGDPGSIPGSGGTTDWLFRTGW